MCYMTTALIPHQIGSSSCLEYFNPTKNMAIDTIKVNDGAIPKPFPFPHHTTNTSTTPHGNLIIEIIFSSDPSNTNTIGKEDVDEEDVDEDAGDGDDYDDSSSEESEDDEGSVDEEESDCDSESNEDDYEDEDDDEEEDEEDGSEDFGNGFESENDDLIVDFGTNDDDDGLLVEFEDMSMDDIPSPPAPKVNPIPFWFTHEEQDQIKMIFASYAKTMNIEEQRKACIRAPAPFIGRIIRTPLKPADNDEPANHQHYQHHHHNNNKNNNAGNKVFKTLDKVEVYLRELYPLGTLLPLSRVAWLLTEWDSVEGIPIHSVELAKSAKKSTQKRAMTNQTSTLFCAPIFNTKDDYQFSVSSSSSSSSSFSSSSSLSSSPSSFECSSPPPLMYASTSSTNVSISRISPFLPEHCRVITFSLD